MSLMVRAKESSCIPSTSTVNTLGTLEKKSTVTLPSVEPTIKASRAIADGCVLPTKDGGNVMVNAKLNSFPGKLERIQ